MLNSKDEMTYKTSITSDQTENYNFINTYYSDLLQGNTDKSLNVHIPTLNQLLKDGTNYQGLSAPIQLEIKIDRMPSQLIQKKYADIGLIYYTAKELVTYNTTVPNDHWEFNDNGSLVYVQENITEQHSYYRPAAGSS